MGVDKPNALSVCATLLYDTYRHLLATCLPVCKDKYSYVKNKRNEDLFKTNE